MQELAAQAPAPGRGRRAPGSRRPRGGRWPPAGRGSGGCDRSPAAPRRSDRRPAAARPSVEAGRRRRVGRGGVERDAGGMRGGRARSGASIRAPSARAAGRARAPCRCGWIRRRRSSRLAACRSVIGRRGRRSGGRSCRGRAGGRSRGWAAGTAAGSSDAGTWTSVGPVGCPRAVGAPPARPACRRPAADSSADATGSVRRHSRSAVACTGAELGDLPRSAPAWQPVATWAEAAPPSTVTCTRRSIRRSARSPGSRRSGWDGEEPVEPLAGSISAAPSTVGHGDAAGLRRRVAIRGRESPIEQEHDADHDEACRPRLKVGQWLRSG